MPVSVCAMRAVGGWIGRNTLGCYWKHPLFFNRIVVYLYREGLGTKGQRQKDRRGNEK